MALEGATFINGLVTSNPVGTDEKAQGDDHIRLIKAVLRNNFPNANKAFRFPHTVQLATVDSPRAQVAADLNIRYAVDATAGAFTLNLLLAATAGSGFVFHLRKTDTSTNPIILTPQGGELINGTTSYSFRSGGVIVFCDGAAWHVLLCGLDINSLEVGTVTPDDFIPFYDTSENKNKKTLSGGFSLPIGGVMDFAGVAAPAGWLFAFGQAVSRTTYSALFALIGITYGAGNGTTTFNLPDLRGRVVVAPDAMGGVAANNITTITTTLASVGGEEEHTLVTAETPSHLHDDGTLGAASSGNHSHTLGLGINDGNVPPPQATDGGGGAGTATTSTDGAHTHDVTGNTGETGGDAPHNNLQPMIFLNKMIFAGV